MTLSPATAIRPLRKVVINDLREGIASVSRRVFTIPVKQTETRFPRLVIFGYTENPENFYGRPGSNVAFSIRGEVKSEAGDDQREMLYEDLFAVLHDQEFEIEGHQLLEGSLTRNGDYGDPDGKTIYFAATFRGHTRVLESGS